MLLSDTVAQRGTDPTLSRAVLILQLQLGTRLLLCSLLSLLLKHSTAFMLRHSSRMLLAACLSHLHGAEQRVLGAMQESYPISQTCIPPEAFPFSSHHAAQLEAHPAPANVVALALGFM